MSLHDWGQFAARACRLQSKDSALGDLWQWVKDEEELVVWQIEHRPLGRRKEGNPRTLGGLETKLDRLKRWIDPRIHGFRNRERLERLLMLMQLELNGQANVDDYTRSIRKWLLTRDGQPAPRRMIIDSYGTSSLISAKAQKFRKVPDPEPRPRGGAPPDRRFAWKWASALPQSSCSAFPPGATRAPVLADRE
jgi:hypothetical protein